MPASGLTYEDFVDTTYEPAPDELVCTFRLTPAEGMDREAAASRVAAESSNGTWTELHTPGVVADLRATAFEVNGDVVRVAYPAELFEAGNVAQVLSCVAGNVFGMKAVDRLRLVDCEWPAGLVEGFPGPQFGASVRETVFGVTDRPLTATVPKPKVGLSPAGHAEVGYEAWVGGLDFLKDDENLTDQPFNRFGERLTASLDARDRAAEQTGEPKSYLVNVTGTATEMLERADEVASRGGEYVMVDVVTAGWAAVQSLRERCERLGLAIHAHRAMHAAFDRVPDHGVSMRVLAQVCRLCGVDQLHTGTAGLGKLENEDTVGINAWLRGDCHGLRDVLPVASGGLHPGLVPELLDRVGTAVCVQAGGGVHGHPDGTRAGARALRAAVDAAVAGDSLAERADEVPKLATALETWGTETPR
ncbi:MAG: type III ribulose-bisphosphate carboxylase [Halobacteriaceae archaeon]